jgi:hypothetical protein
VANTVYVLFIAVENDLVLPIRDWTKDVGDLLQNAHDNLPTSGLICQGGRRGRPVCALIELRNFCRLPGLSFLGSVCTTLQELEIVIAIQSLTKIVEVLLSNNKAVKNIIIKLFFGSEETNYQKRIAESFTASEIYTEYDWESEPEYALFSLIKALLFVMTDALVNNKVFLYVQLEA